MGSARRLGWLLVAAVPTIGVIMIMLRSPEGPGQTGRQADASASLPSAQGGENLGPDPTREEYSTRTIEDGRLAPTSERMIRVVSNTGLPIDYVDVTSGSGDAERIAVNDGVARIPSKGLLSIAATAHKAREIDDETRVVTLEAIVSLRITSPNMAAKIADVMVMPTWGSPDVTDLVSYGVVSGNEWCIAADPQRVCEAFPVSELSFTIRGTNGRVINIDRSLSVLGNATYQMDPQILDVDGNEAELMVRTVGVALPPESQLGVAIRDVGTPSSAVDTYEWGSVRVAAPTFGISIQQTAYVAESGLVFQAVPLGLQLAVTVKELRGSAYGRCVFRHNGDGQVVTLNRGVSIALRAIDDNGRPVSLCGARVIMEPSEEATEVDRYAWRTETKVLPGMITDDGAVHLDLPGQVPVTPLASLACPAHWVIEIRIPGYDKAAAAVFVAGPTKQLTLRVTRKSQLMMVRGLRQSQAELLLNGQVGVAVLGTQSGANRSYEISKAESGEHDVVQCYLVSVDERGETGQPSDVAFVRDQLILPNIVIRLPDELVFLRRGEEGVYSPVRLIDHDMVIVGQQNVSQERVYECGIGWEGIDVVLCDPRFAPDEKEKRVPIQVPVNATFWCAVLVDGALPVDAARVVVDPGRSEVITVP